LGLGVRAGAAVRVGNGFGLGSGLGLGTGLGLGLGLVARVAPCDAEPGKDLALGAQRDVRPRGLHRVALLLAGAQPELGEDPARLSTHSHSKSSRYSHSKSSGYGYSHSKSSGYSHSKYSPSSERILPALVRIARAMAIPSPAMLSTCHDHTYCGCAHSCTWLARRLRLRLNLPLPVKCSSAEASSSSG